MLKLIKLEWKKHILWKYIRNAVIVTASFLGLLLLISSDPSTTTTFIEQTGKSEINSLTEMFLNMAYLVFTGAMMSTFVVSAYENKMIHLMFSYPINRKKILLSKIFAVSIFNFFALTFSKLFIYTVLLFIGSTTLTGVPMAELSFWISTLLGSVISVSMGCVSLLIGLKTKSSKTTLIASFVIMLVIMQLTQGNIFPYHSINGIIAYPIQFVVAIIAIFLSIYNVETKDVM